MKQLLVRFVADILTFVGVLLYCFEITATIVLVKVYFSAQFYSKSDHLRQTFQLMIQPVVFAVWNVTVEGFKEG